MRDEKRCGHSFLKWWAFTFLIGIASSVGTANAEPPADVDCSEESLDGCFTSSDQMDEYLARVTPLLTEFFVASYGEGFPKPKIRYVAADESGESGCIDEDGAAEFDRGSYFYCGPDRTMYVGQAMMWWLHQHAGSLGPALGLAHEWGHHLQRVRHVRARPQGAVENHVAIENQADCIAGAWLLDQNNKGRFKGTGHTATMATTSIALGDAEGRSHGIDLERLLSFSKGSTQGLVSCDQYSQPGTPVSPR
jgi:predicted metalloprotease